MSDSIYERQGRKIVSHDDDDDAMGWLAPEEHRDPIPEGIEMMIDPRSMTAWPAPVGVTTYFHTFVGGGDSFVGKKGKIFCRHFSSRFDRKRNAANLKVFQDAFDDHRNYTEFTITIKPPRESFELDHDMDEALELYVEFIRREKR